MQDKFPSPPKSYTVRGGFDLRAYAALWHYHASKTSAFAKHHCTEVLEGDIPALEEVGTKPIADAGVLEIGCGSRAGGTLIMHTLGARIVGIDYDYTAPRINLSSLINIARLNGFQRAVKTLVRHVAFDRRYYKEVERVFGRSLIRDGVDLRRMDVCNLDFPDNSFDYAISHAVFEHVHDVPRALAEVRRVLRPEGAARISTHLFPSLSGGHRLEWAYPDERPSETVPRWDHLRERRFPAHVYLNELREADYLALFARHFDIVDVQITEEGASLLTEDLRQELANYTLEDLTHKELIVLLRKPESSRKP